MSTYGAMSDLTNVLYKAKNYNFVLTKITFQF